MTLQLDRRSVLAGLAALAGCAPQPAPYTTSETAGAAIPFDDAVQFAANQVMANASPRGSRQTVVIDPLVDGMTGEQSSATQSIQARILDVARASYPQYDFQPFSARAVARSPWVMVGTFTPVDARGQSAGAREAFRFCLVLADLQSGRTLAKAVTRARPGGVDTTPTSFFQDSPAWTEDAVIKGYVNTCQATRVGDAIAPEYLGGILAASIVSEAIEAYGATRYAEALELYRDAQRTRAGDQLRVHNGLYLTNWKLNRRDAAEAAFGGLVDYSLANNRLAVKLLFRQGSTGLTDTGSSAMWLRQIATRAARRNTCLQVAGHTSRSGSAALNERLSLLRAEFVKARLEEAAPDLRGRLIAAGAGSGANLVGTGRDDATDALDRRVEFRVIRSCA